MQQFKFYTKENLLVRNNIDTTCMITAHISRSGYAISSTFFMIVKSQLLLCGSTQKLLCETLNKTMCSIRM